MIQFGMPTLIENRTLQDNISLCAGLGLRFIELNMNFPEYQLEGLEQTDRLLEAAQREYRNDELFCSRCRRDIRRFLRDRGYR